MEFDKRCAYIPDVDEWCGSTCFYSKILVGLESI